MSTKRHWTTLEDLNQTPEVAKRRGEEFVGKPKEHFDALPKGGLKVGRRDFMKWSTGALALAATACERKPTEKIIPYAQQPPEIMPGVANYYASTCTECAAGCGTLVRTREGRPIKVEGNPLHPINQGTLCVRGQSALLNLYDPDRLRTPVLLQRTTSLEGLVGSPAALPYDQHVPTNVWNTGETLREDLHPIQRTQKAMSWAEADKKVAGLLSGAGSRAVMLTGTIHGPAREQLFAEFLAVFPMRHVMYDSLNPDALAGAQQAAYGAPIVPRYFFDRAEMVVTIGADPLGSGISRQEYAVGFGKQHKLHGGRMSRLVSFEPAMSLTGLNADDRFLVPPSQLLAVALGLAHQVALASPGSRYAGDAGVNKALSGFNPSAVETAAGLPAGTLAQIAAELWEERGKGIVMAGGLAAANGDQKHLEVVAAFLNSVLENEGATIDSSSPSRQARGSDADMLALIGDMNAGKVDTLVVYGSNPAYSLPPAAGFVAALAKVPNVVAIADRLDETAQLSDMVLPLLHGMESWGDAEPQPGLLSLIQPTIEPLFGGRSFEDTLIQVAYQTPAGAMRFKAPPPAPAPVPPPAPVAPGTAPVAGAVPTATAAAAAAGGVTPKASSLPATGAATAAPTAPGSTQAATTAGAAAKAGAAAAAAPPAAPAPAAVAVTFHDYLQEYWRTEVYAKNNLAGSFDDFWTGVLQAGVFDPEAAKRLQPGAARAFKSEALAGPSAAAAAGKAAAGSGELELSLAVNPVMGDGWWANNAFLLEIPDPVSKICWDNFFAISPATAAKLGLGPNDAQEYVIAEATVGGRTLRAPVYAQPGIHPGVVTMAVGFGRASAGQIGTGVGVNAATLATVAGDTLVYSGAKVQLKKVDAGYILASPQGNSYLEFGDNQVTGETGRPENIIRETTLVQLQTNPRAGNPEPEPQTSLWNNGGASDHPYPGHHWGMTIDLNACIGCNACVAACYAENNVPVVGKDQVWRGREMAWIRINRYFEGDPANPDIALQPMLCQQCENAGCESVCPVIATVTDSEGLNVQVYNRCVGTRFCSNNCIYKVRRFNFYNYSTVRATPLELALNPEVTVRTRGIMEKCTFCVQRIHEGRYKAKERGVAVQDGDIRTACQQTCPTQAIDFGDMNDPASRMMRARTERGYRVLEDMNFKSSITYLTKVRNRRTERMSEVKA